MKDFRIYLEEMLDELKEERDELRVRLHLAKLEGSEEWQKLEAKMAKLESRAKEIGDATVEASQDMGAAAKILAEEIRNGFKKIARHF